MRAMVLAAGLGTRLRPLTLERPKAAVPVANRPLAWFGLDHLARSGASRVVLNAHHLPRVLRAEIEPHVPPNLEVSYVVERSLLGTGGGIRNCRELLCDGDAPIVIMNGDILFAPDLTAAVATHRRLGAIATMVLRPDPAAETFGAIDIDHGGRVRRLLGTPEAAAADLRTLMFTGVHVLSPRAFDDLPMEGCIVRHAYRRWVDEGAVVGGHVDESLWLDLGTPRTYLDANLALARGVIGWPGIERSADATIRDASTAREAGTGSASAAEESSGVSTPPADDRARHAERMETNGVRVRDAVIGADVEIAAGSTVERAVLWSGARVSGHVHDAIVSREHVVSL